MFFSPSRLCPLETEQKARSEWETRPSVEEPMLSTGLHLTSESTGSRPHCMVTESYWESSFVLGAKSGRGPAPMA
jgi:hypothetical protein